MTKQEAKTKWCPFAHALGTLSKPVDGVETVVADGPHNRGYAIGGGLHNCMCIASACMAWRWRGHRDRLNHKTVDRFTDIAEGDSDRDLEAVGYCGLAGKP